MTSEIDTAMKFVSTYGYSCFWQLVGRDFISSKYQNDILPYIISTEAILNFCRRFKWIILEDEQTGLLQGPYLKDKVKIPKEKK